MILLLLALSGSLAFGDRIPMKVIEHAASPSGAGLSGGSLGITTNTPDLSSMIPPARHNEFTGPEDLRPLVGRCMTTVQRNYHVSWVEKRRFCVTLFAMRFVPSLL